MLLPVLIYGHPLLRRVSEEIPPDYPDLEKFLNDLWQTMDVADGVGLAAPQVGKNIRVFVVDGSVFSKQDPSCADFRKAFINARITERFGGDIVRSEGCLSIPGIHENIARKEKIRMVYEDENRERHEEIFEGIKAWIIQHEYDHLEGRMFTDHLSPLMKRLLKSKLHHVSLGKTNTHYRVILPK